MIRTAFTPSLPAATPARRVVCRGYRASNRFSIQSEISVINGAPTGITPVAVVTVFRPSDIKPGGDGAGGWTGALSLLRFLRRYMDVRGLRANANRVREYNSAVVDISRPTGGNDASPTRRPRDIIH